MTAKEWADNPRIGVRTWFAHVDDRGNLRELRLPIDGEDTCFRCSFEYFAARQGGQVDVAASFPDEVHNCNDNFVAPLWYVTCPGHQLQGQRNDREDCGCTTVPLAGAIENLPRETVEAALTAHLIASRDVYRHFAAAQAVDDGLSPSWDDVLCAACIADTEEHAALLEGEVNRLAEELFGANPDANLVVRLSKGT